MAKVSRWKLRHSDRSGFRYFEEQMITEKGYKIGPDEHDTPPPSDESLGGEGEVQRGGDFWPFYGSYTSNVAQVTQTFTIGNSTNQVAFNKKSEDSSAFIKILSATNNTTAVMGTGLQISAANNEDKLCIKCVGSYVLFTESRGLALVQSAPFLMASGAILNLVYNATDSLWHETSRSESSF